MFHGLRDDMLPLLLLLSSVPVELPPVIFVVMF